MARPHRPRPSAPARSARRSAIVLRTKANHRALLADESALDGSVEVEAVDSDPADVLPRLSELMQSNRLDPEERTAIVELGYNLMANGKTRLARAVFEGLALLDPHNAYVHLGAAIANDDLGHIKSAEAFYERARRIDPADPRPDINQAELRIQAGDRRTAYRLVLHGLEKAERAEDELLRRKAAAMKSLLEETQKAAQTRRPRGTR